MRVNQSGCSRIHGWSGEQCGAKSSATSRPWRARGRDEMIEVGERAERRIDGGVAAGGAADRPRASRVVGAGDQARCSALAMRRADRMDRRQVDDVEPERGDRRESARPRRGVCPAGPASSRASAGNISYQDANRARSRSTTTASSCACRVRSRRRRCRRHQALTSPRAVRGRRAPASSSRHARFSAMRASVVAASPVAMRRGFGAECARRPRRSRATSRPASSRAASAWRHVAKRIGPRLDRVRPAPEAIGHERAVPAIAHRSRRRAARDARPRRRGRGRRSVPPARRVRHGGCRPRPRSARRGCA